MDPLDFLTQHAPFDSLSDDGRRQLAGALEITWERSGGRILERGEVDPFLYALRKGHVRLELDGQQVAHLGPGQIFGLTSLGDGDEPLRLDVVAESDCLLYRVPGHVVRTLCDGEPPFAHFFFESLAGRLRKLADSQAMTLTSDLGLEVRDLVRRAPVTLTLEEGDGKGAEYGPVTLGDAARTMQSAGVSSVLLVRAGEPKPTGIVTDRDLRRALADGLGPDHPVRDVMTTPVDWLDAASPGAEALLELLRSRRHHLVLHEDGALVGVVTHSDLLRRHLQSPGAVLDSIRSAQRPGDLEGYADRVARTIETLHRSGVEATQIGRLVAALNDALGSRLLDLAEAELRNEFGPPPCDYAWIVFGSEGRHEQSFLTDQDNALIYADPGPSDAVRVRDYFQRLAELGVGSLLTVGFPECKGGFMATNWCLPLSGWTERFRHWITEPEPENLMRVANFFDWRTVHGVLDLEPLEELVRGARENRRFLGQLARASMRKRPPLGLMRRIVEDEGGVDLKSGALMPISGLARLFALESGDRQGSTIRRLERAARTGVVSPDGSELLVEAFRFAFGLRLRRQLADRAAGREITNHVGLADLSAGERRHLKEAFLAVERMQRAIEQQFDTGLLG